LVCHPSQCKNKKHTCQPFISVLLSFMSKHIF